jgi:DNA-binding transcriptional LysR family regulator
MSREGVFYESTKLLRAVWGARNRFVSSLDLWPGHFPGQIFLCGACELSGRAFDDHEIALGIGLPQRASGLIFGAPVACQLGGAMPERVIELGSYHAMLGCVVAGMGAALLPESVLTTFLERRRLSVHALPAGANRARTVLIRRKGASSANVQALAAILATAGDAVGRHRSKT